ncbi:MAG: hypothetical protein KBT04_00730 [Bacteroidales bacterium]|nr:hypothetical protein [Candidatus Colimorpha onthohippi]
MKKIFLTICVVAAFVANVWAQAPLKMDYQMIVRDPQGNLVTSRLVHVKFSIFHNSPMDELVYSEHATASTDRSGWVRLVIGDGLPVYGDMRTVDWSAGNYYLRVDVDPKGGNDYTTNVQQQLVSAPYALYAASADYNTLKNLPNWSDSIRMLMNNAGNDGNMGDNLEQEKRLKMMVDVAVAKALQNASKNTRTDNVKVSESVAETASRKVRTYAVTEGVLPGYFSVSETKRVRFAIGNLQYSEEGSHVVANGQTVGGTWRFATHQYECVTGQDNWSDQFGWGRTGCDNDFESQDVCNDWGMYNAISGGGDEPGMWRMLTMQEWNYLRSLRKDAEQKMGLATVAGQRGIVLLPDDWKKPGELTFVSGFVRGYATNNYTAYQWETMQRAGAVFLPAAGSRINGSVTSSGTYGSYWSSSSKNANQAFSFDFHTNGTQTIGNQSSLGLSVRLVANE